MDKHLTIRTDEKKPPAFHNHAAFCVGTGRMGLALHHEYLEQLARVQEQIGFSYIRGHGLFSDDMAIFQVCEDESGSRRVEYNFTYLDRVMDAYLKLNIKPFLELGFMPEKLASGGQTIFYWKGNVTPPRDYAEWAALVRATIAHLVSRYGEAQVASWPVEVWNEPNLPGFWENADLDEYLKLYDVSARAVKAVLPNMRVGGPAVCGTENCHHFLKTFLSYCDQNKVPLDFVTRHAYMAEAPERKGRYVYHDMRSVDSLMDEMAQSRAIIDSFPAYKGMAMHITEFNTSYTPQCPIHDTNYNAAIVAGLLARLGDVAASYAYWTFGDVFEETGVPFTPFSGGFGLVASGGIEKPTFWTFAFFKRLTGKCVHRSENAVVVKEADGGYRGVCWQIGGMEALALNIVLPAADGKHTLILKQVDESTCNPRKAWYDMGQSPSPSKAQADVIKLCAQPVCRTEQLTAKAGEIGFTIRLAPNGVTYFETAPLVNACDRGFDYTRYTAAE